jgi:pyruvate/2-oxoglutarate dehydrogenase complex dihydrolipoamide dehydrogenase (E3) component
MPHEFDAIVIGSGQAGNPLAHNLADRGWTVALIEREHLGGSCINYGCTPTKTMLASAGIAYDARRAHEFGIQVRDVRVDMARVVERKNRIVREWREGQEKQVAKRPSLRLFRGSASFTSDRAVTVAGETLSAPRVFINTGTRSRVPSVEGIEQVPYLTNRTILDLTGIPEHLLVLGGSYIGLEFGQMFRRLGSRVTVIARDSQIMKREDEDIATSLQAALESEGIDFQLSSRATAVEQDARGTLCLTIDSEQGREELRGTHLLVASGRQPNTGDLNLAAAGVETDRGWIKVNEYLETSAEGIYALGDVKGGPAFTHISYNDFQIVYHNLFHDEKRSTAGRLVPYALYTDPELGRVGLTERQAREQGYRVKAGAIPMSSVARATEQNNTKGMMKVVVDADTGSILGAAILSVAGGELVQTIMALMMAGAPWTTFHKAIFIHPTLSEGFFSLMDQVAAQEA